MHKTLLMLNKLCVSMLIFSSLDFAKQLLLF